ncbi:prolactin-like [Fukomys damarensis]|uniref:prolactin-like n=1 Tax=Fukomys damarensis TaxID=885580 RepID=UPI00054034A4|nr:prolactin-like [Fukomys damarensis]
MSNMTVKVGSSCMVLRCSCGSEMKMQESSASQTVYMQLTHGQVYEGPLLLLLVSGQVLFHTVASRPTCVRGAGCQVIVQDLNDIAAYASSSMYFQALEQLLRFESVYSLGSDYFLPAIQRCHTDDILTPSEREMARWMQHKDLLNAVILLLNSWKEPLKHIAQEAHRLPKLGAFFSIKYRGISFKYEQLKEIMVQIASTLDIDVPGEVEFALWSDMESLKSSDEQTHLFTVYNTLLCFSRDAKRIKFLISILKCKTDNKGTC